ncbi:MAG TPA: hypothetical protein VIC04_06985 [Terriglobia bacterium]|jgi:hypothetical protein
MKLLLINDAGSTVACFDDLQQYADRSPAQAFALLDLVEKLIESLNRDSGEQVDLERRKGLRGSEAEEPVQELAL